MTESDKLYSEDEFRIIYYAWTLEIAGRPGFYPPWPGPEPLVIPHYFPMTEEDMLFARGTFLTFFSSPMEWCPVCNATHRLVGRCVARSKEKFPWQ